MALSSPGVIGVAQSGRYAPGESDLKISSWKVNNITGFMWRSIVFPAKFSLISRSRL